jgi:rieske iron-sulfur protein
MAPLTALRKGTVYSTEAAAAPIAAMSDEIASVSTWRCAAAQSAKLCACREQPPSPVRRALLKGGLAAGLTTIFAETALATDPKALRPQAGDLFVFFTGEKAGQVVNPSDLVVGAAPVLAWPVEPASRIVRDGSRLNLVVLVRLAEASLDDLTRERAADGIVAYSASCTHAVCPVNGWKADRKILWCPCHNSEFDPRNGAKVVFGPAPRPLPALPLKIADGALAAAGTFLGKVGMTS